MKNEAVKDLLRLSLRDKFPLFDKRHSLGVSKIRIGYLWVGYSSGDFTPRGRKGTNFDLNLVDDLCYITSIRLEECQRGKGFGWALYEAVHDFARKVGCEKVRETPSGWVVIDGKRIKTRREYMLSKGYVPFGSAEVELVL
jgi:GNAT superfamily N-acetyltransferase